MNNNTPPKCLRRCAGGRSDRRGSAILLVLVAMVLMAILAGSLLQLTRFERIPRAESNIEVVIASVIDEILNQLTEDLIDDTGLFMNTAGTAGGYDEPYDYPWTNGAISGDRRPENALGVPQNNILGGRYDDTWLASHMPFYTGAGDTVGTWRKITSLTGIWLGDAAGNADLSGVASPSEFNHSSLTVAVNSDTNLATNSALLVDADGDGIGDSRWEWAPLRQVGATQYVMAVRIVDLSARMDMNVALGSTSTPAAGGAIALSTEDPFGDGPTELDGAAFFSLLANTAGSGVSLANARTEWRKSMQFRLTANDAAAGTLDELNYDGDNDPPDAASRRDYWTKGASRTSNTFGRNEDAVMGPGLDYSSDATFGLTDAFELLQGNGLNSDNVTAVEDLMPNFLRRDTSGIPEDGYAVGAGTNQPNGWTARQFWELDPRKHVSMYTGASIAAKPFATGQARALKLDVNKALEDDNLTALRNRINQVLSVNNGTLITLFPHLTSSAEISDQLAVNLYDYVDLDNTLTTFNGNIGFEALPYITEVYTQRLYNATTVTPNAMTGNDDVTWDAQGQQGYAIEIGNPFGRLEGGAWQGREILLTNVFIRIGAAGTQQELSVLAGQTTLGPGEVLILRRNSDTDAGTGLNDISALYQASTKTEIDVEVTEDLNPGDQTIELFATVAAAPGAAGSTATWAYAASEIQVPAAQISETGLTTGTVMAGYQGYARTNYQGVGDSLQMMAVSPTPGVNNGFAEQITSLAAPSENCDTAGLTPTGAATLTTDTPALQNPTKPNAPNGFTELNATSNQQLVWQDNPRERLHWVGDILQIPLIRSNDPSAPGATTADSLYYAAGSSTSLTDSLTGDGMEALMLPYKANAALSLGTGTLNVPHALLLLEQLTTFNPATDGEDGDGQGHTETFADPDDNEVLVPGKLNINTAPRETLVRLLPFPQLATREAIADEIIAQRQLLKNFGANAPAAPGIPYTSAMYQSIEGLAANPSQLGGDDTTLGPDGVQIDLNNHETTPGTYSGTGADGVADDREEEIMLAKWLTEMTDTRSDVFAAYIVVQGYQTNNFTAGATESARLIVIFSRANVKEAGDKAVEIGRFRIN